MGKKKKTHQEFVRQVELLTDNEYQVLGQYQDAKTKIKLLHITCGNQYDTKPNNFLSGKRCPFCFERKMLTTEKFKKKVFNLVGDKYTVLSQYTGSLDKIKMRHNSADCNYYEYEVTPTNFIHNNSRCPKCAGRT